MAQLVLTEVATAPSAPASGQLSLYALTDNVVYVQNSSGISTAIGSSNGITQLTGDVTAVGPGSAVATVAFVGGQSAANVAAATVAVEGATSANVSGAIVERDVSGNFSANVITASLNGNASTSTSSVSAISFTGPLVGDVTGYQSATVVSMVDGQTAAAVAAAAVAVAAATSGNTASTLVLRDASGNFSAGVITSALIGNVTGNVSGSATSFTGSLSGDVTGTQSATVVSAIQGYSVSTSPPTDAQFLIYNSGTTKYAPQSMSGDASITNVGAITVSTTAVTGKLLTGYTTGVNTPILATNSILTAFENLQAQISGSVSTAITALTGDVSASGPGSATATIEAIQGNPVSGSTGTGDVVFSVSPTLTGTLSAASANFSGAISASNFSGSSSGSNSGDVTVTSTNSIDLAFSSGQNGLNANLNLSAASPDAGYIPAVSEIKSDGLLVEVLAGAPVQIGTSNSIGAAASASRSDHVHAITSSVVLGLDLTGYTTGINTPINATDTLLQGFENLQAQVSAGASSAITALTGDGTATGPGSVPFTLATVNSNVGSFASVTVNGKGLVTAAVALSGDATTSGSVITLDTVNSNVGSFASVTVNAKGLVTAAVALSGDATTSGSVITLDTVNSNVGSFGSSTSIPSFTVNAKGLVTAASSNVVVAPAGTLTGTTLASNVVASSLTSVGTITSGIWNAGAVTSSAITDSSLTPGSVVFAGTGGLLNQDNANLFWNDSTIALGIGTGSPQDILHMVASTASVNHRVLLDGYGSGNVGYRTRAAQGTALAPTASQSGNTLGLYGALGYGASQFAASNTGAMAIHANENFTNTSNATYVRFLTTPTGSVAAAEVMRLNSTGNILIGTTTDNGQLLQVNGTEAITSSSISALTINTTSFIFDSVNNALGIGLQPQTTSVITTLNISGTAKPIWLFNYGTGSSTGVRSDFARGTVGSPTAAQAGDALNFISGRGYGASQFAASSTGTVNIYAGETFTNTSNATYVSIQATPTGSVTKAEHFRVSGTGVTVGPQSASTDIHQINGGLNTTTRTVTASTFTVDTTTTDYIIYTDSTSNPIAITLPAPTNGRVLIIQDKTGNAGTNAVTIKQNVSETINGKASFVLDSAYSGVMLTSDGTNWATSLLPIRVNTITASAYTVDSTNYDSIILTDSTSNTINITLPAATDGRVLTIQDKTGQASTNHITITPPGSVTINGVNAPITIAINYAGRTLISDGTNWTYSALLPVVVPPLAISASAIDWSTGNVFTKTLGANTTFTFSNAASGQTIVVRLTNTASNYTVTWPTVRWPAAVAPTMSTGAVSDVYTFIWDGSNYYGSYVQAMA